jgi:hypothetical protein
MSDMESRKASAYKKGVITFVGLMVLTIIEYFFAGITTPLFVIALLKSAVIMQYFMHIYKLWSKEDHH